MKVSFVKYHGLGNDFILCDQLPEGVVPRLCDRRVGIGADGVILLGPQNRMQIFNPDGKEASFCGNGLRCLVHWVALREGIRQPVVIKTGSGPIRCWWEGDEVGAALPEPKVIAWEKKIGGLTAYVVDTGVPHAILFDAPAEVLPAIRASEGANASTVTVLSKEELKIRTFERGVEGETMLCGSGAAAAAWVAHRLKMTGSSVRVYGVLPKAIAIRVTQCQGLEMVGGAELCFSGEIELD